MSSKKTFLISTLILFVGGVFTIIIFLTEPKAIRGGATKETAMLVEIIKVKRGDYRPTITAMGTVEPSKDIILSSRVSGEIIKLDSSFVPGGFVNQGETLLKIDPIDYHNILQQRKSHLNQTIADLKIEMGRQNVAQQDFQLLGENISEEKKPLILRKPQLDAAKSRVEAAQAAVNQAELDLQRTTIKAPFDAHILSRNVNIGSLVSPGEHLGRLVGIDSYWVVTTVPLGKLPWLTFPKNNEEKGSAVRIRLGSAWRDGEYRQGYLYKRVGILEEQTRMAQVLISIPDPLALKKNSEKLNPLMIGSYVEVNIQGKEIKDVVRLHRDYLRKNDTVWILENKKLHIRDVEIIFRDKTYAYIISGLNNHHQVVTTNLTTVVEGASLRLKSDIPTGQRALSTTAEHSQSKDLAQREKQ